MVPGLRPPRPRMSFKWEVAPLDTRRYPFGRVVGMFMHLTNCTRPDMLYHVGAVTRGMSEPTKEL